MKKLLIFIFLFSVSISAFCQQKITFTIDGKKDSALVYLPNGYKISNSYPALIYSVGVSDTTDLFIPFFLRNKSVVKAIPYPGQTFFSSKRRNALWKYLIGKFSIDTMNITILQQ